MCLQSDIHLPAVRRRVTSSGFSLIEVLVATALLVMIVMMLAQVFRQSTVAWDSGLNRTETAMKVRSVIGAIERDLRGAVNATNFPGCGLSSPMEVKPNGLKFMALIGLEEEPVLVEITGGPTVTRKVSPCRYNKDTGSWSTESSDSNQLMDDNDYSVSFSANSGETGEMPESVVIDVEYNSTESFGLVGARSAGRDGQFGTDDDIDGR